MGKTYVGSRLRQLRRDYDLSQASLAATLGLSASYVNQIEHDVRPLTDPVLDRITSTFDVDATFFSRDDNSRLLAEVQDAMLDKDLYPTPPQCNTSPPCLTRKSRHFSIPIAITCTTWTQPLKRSQPS